MKYYLILKKKDHLHATKYVYGFFDVQGLLTSIITQRVISLSLSSLHSHSRLNLIKLLINIRIKIITSDSEIKVNKP